MGQALGIEVTDDVVRGVLVDGTPKKYRVVGFATAPVTPDADSGLEGAQASAIKDVAGQLHRGKDSAAITVASSECSFRMLNLPFTDEEQVRKVVKFELEGHLHQWNIDDVVVDFYPVEKGKGESRLMAVAAPKKYVGRLISSCEKAGFEPLSADLDAAALYNAALACGSVSPKGTYIFLHVNERDALLVVVEDQVLRLARSIRTVGPRVVEEKKEENGNEGSEEKKEEEAAEEKSPESAEGEEKSSEDIETWDEVFVALEDESHLGDADHIPRLIQRELLRSLLSLRLESPLAGVYVSGMWEKAAGIADSLANTLRREVRVLDIFTSVESNLAGEHLKEAVSQAPIAFGAALKQIGIDAGGLELRQEDLRYKRRFDQLKAPLAFLAGCLAFILVMENIYLFKKNGVLERNFQKYFEVAKGLAQNKARIKYTPHPDLTYSDYFPALQTKVNKKLKDLQEAVGQGPLEMYPSSFEAWRNFFLALQEAEGDLGNFLIEKIEAQSEEPRGRDKPPYVLMKVDFVFLGDAATAAGSSDRFESTMKKKGWDVRARGESRELASGTGQTYDITIPFPKG